MGKTTHSENDISRDNQQERLMKRKILIILIIIAVLIVIIGVYLYIKDSIEFQKCCIDVFP